MNKLGLLKKMLPGLLPILIFIIADEIWGTQIGLIVAVVLGILQLLYFAIKDKKLEKFVLMDTILITAMGGVSIILHNDLFFKLKPAIIELILAAVLAYSLFSKNNIMLNMSKRYIKDLQTNEAQEAMMRKSIRNMLILLFIHLIILIYSSFWMSTEAWAFVSTALFYIMIFGYFGIELLIRYLTNRNQKDIEILPIVDEEGKVIGKASREECHTNPDIIYPVVRLHLFNPKGELLLQRRSLKSDIEPGKWDAAVAGHIRFGETAEQAIVRECAEELNHKLENYQGISQRLFRAKTSTALMIVYIGIIEGMPSPNLAEVEEISFFKLNEIPPLINKGLTTKGLIEELPQIKSVKFENRKS
jgi:isopentenyldiphosphate isomerase